MAKTRPGIDRLTKQELAARKSRYAALLHAHVSTCGMCAHSVTWPYDMCNAWWKLATAQHKVMRRLAEYQADEYPGGLTLF